MDHEEIRSLLAPYVLGAVSAEETTLVRHHIMTCESCLAEADGYSEVVTSLALAVESDDAAIDLVESVMAKVASERREPQTASSPSWWGRFSLVPAVTVAALLVAVAVLSVLLVDARGDLSEQRRSIAALAGDTGMRLTGGEGVAVILETESGGVFLASGLDAPPEDHVYQLWLTRGSRAVSFGTFDVTEGGTAVLTTQEALAGFDGAAVTVEPEGGSPQPTGAQVLHT